MLKKLFFFSLLFLIFFNYKIFANDEAEHLDVVLVIDTSASMTGNDPSRIAVEGVKLFIDLLENKGSRVSVIGFNGELTFKTPLIDINSSTDKLNLLKDIDKIKYVGFTDIGLALKEAESILFKKSDKNNKPLIIMFTDGYVEVSQNSGRTNADSFNEIDQVLLGAKGKIPIYTIGLNKNNRVDKELIEKIAVQTYAKNFMTNDPKDLPEIFFNIFTDLIKSDKIELMDLISDGKTYNNVKINIPNSSVKEANIVVYSTAEILDAILKEPSGKTKSLVFSNDVYLSKSKNYSVIKIINPIQGDWELSIKGIENDAIKIHLLYNYDINLLCFTDNTDFKKGKTVDIKGQLVNDLGPILDEALYNSFNAELVVLDENNYVIDKMIMNINKDNFLAHYTLPNTIKKLYFKINAAGSGFYRESNFIEIDIKNNPPYLEKKIENKIFVHFPILLNEIKIKLNDYFKDDDGTNIFYKSETNNNLINVEISPDNILKIKSNGIFSYGKDIVKITATDSNDDFIKSEFEIILIPVFLLFILFLLLIFLIIFIPIQMKHISKNSRLFKGNIKYIILSEGIHGPQKHVSLSLYKGIVSLKQIIEEEDQENLVEINKIFINQSNGEYELEVKNKSNYEIFNLKKFEKEFKLKQNESIRIKNNDESKVIIIDYYL